MGVSPKPRLRGRPPPLNPIMEYLQNLSRAMKTMQNQVARMSRRGSRKEKAFKRNGHGPAPWLTPRNLENDFNREVEGKGTLETDEVPHHSHRQPTPSAARSTSVLDRLGRRLTEHNLRLRLEAKQMERMESERQRREGRPPSHYNERERSLHSRSHREPTRCELQLGDHWGPQK